MLDVGNILRQFVEAVPETVLGGRYVDLSLTRLKVSRNAAAERHLRELESM